ncbi:hypothetical protein [Pleomorphomonas koreensis]|uniref:hypothetical protein n=1 Tax=Pleomorphomonas koreensis TaxID=257440 RepID=UPI0012EC6BCF|nr:hypothetical protein [Pleomorphomonas koreensis]
MEAGMNAIPDGRENEVCDQAVVHCGKSSFSRAMMPGGRRYSPVAGGAQGETSGMPRVRRLRPPVPEHVR